MKAGALRPPSPTASAGGVEGDQRIGQPAEPLEEIVGVARPRPQADLADRALVGAIGFELAQLGVGQALAGHGGDQHQRAQTIGPGQAGRGVARGDQHRQRQDRGGDRLDHQEQEQLDLERRAPILAELGVTRILRAHAGRRPHRDMEAEPQAPRPDQHAANTARLGRLIADGGDQGIGDARRAGRQAPDRVDPAGISGDALDRPRPRTSRPPSPR